MTRTTSCYLYQLKTRLNGCNKYNINIRHRIPNFKKTSKNLVKIKNQKDGSSANIENNSNQQEKLKSLTEFYENLLRNLQRKMTPAQLKVYDVATSEGASI